MEEIKVSVIMPVYNGEKYLRKCLDSVTAQTLREIEIICVDDGSTDKSRDILEEYAAEDPRVQIFHQENKFAGCARNLGMEHASGKYLIFWDSDDYFMPDALELMYERSESKQAQICICDGDKYDEKEDVQYPTDEYLIRRRLPEADPFSREDIGKYLYNFASNVPWNKMFLHSFVLENELQFQELRQANDVYFVMRALFLAERITTVPKALVVYRISNSGSVTGKASETRFCSAQAFKKTFDWLCGQEDFTDEIRQSFANKTIGPLINAWRLQKNSAEAEELYNYYREELFPEFGLFGKDASFFNNPNDFEAMGMMEKLSCWDFMLYQMQSFSRRYRTVEGKFRSEKKTSAALRRTIREKDKELKNLEKKTLPYIASHAVSYIPRHVKKLRNTGKW